MGIPGSTNPMLLGGAAGYEIEQSLRFEANSATEMQKNFSVEGSRDTCTTSVWIKRGRLDVVDYCIWSSRETANFWEEFTIYSDGSIYALCKYSGATRWNMRTNAVLRDPSAWYHLVYVRDTSNATQADRIRIYVNGVRIDSWATQTEPATSGLGGFLGGNFEHKLGKRAGYDDETYDGYMAEFHFLDGTARNADSFGEFDDNGVWRPIEYTDGGYGTNGLYLKFDPAATNGIGEDYSGNGHTMPDTSFTTSGTGTDVMFDTPTTNWCTWNPLRPSQMLGGSATISNGNLNAADAGTSYGVAAQGTIAVSSGKWYWEIDATTVGGSYGAIGIRLETLQGTDGAGYFYGSSGGKGTTVYDPGGTAYGNSYTSGDNIGVALDLTNGKIWFAKNGTWQASGDPAAGTNEAFSGLSGVFSACVGDGQNATSYSWDANFGQRAFAYTPPTGFDNTLSTNNLPAPDIADGSDYFNTVLYTGNGSTQTISGVGFQPDWTWLKIRSQSFDHAVFDVIRGATKDLEPNTTDAEQTRQMLTAFTSDGFSVGNDTQANKNGDTFVAWNWKAGGSGSSNTAGSITSTVSANPTAGFSIVSYTGTGANATVGHGLGVAPSMIICFRRSTGDNHYVYHSTLGSGYYGALNNTNAFSTFNASVVWNSTEPTSTVFSVGTAGEVNALNSTYVTYCFAEVKNYSRIGSYTGNGSSDGPFIATSFAPAWLMIKRSDSTESWLIFDSKRETYNPTDDVLWANLSNAESANYTPQDFLSNGFKIRTSSTSTNASGGTYIFAAFAEHPFGGSSVSPATAR